MRNVLIESSVDVEDIESIEYCEDRSEIVIRTGAGTHVYSVEKSIETYVLNYESPVYVHALAREHRM